MDKKNVISLDEVRMAKIKTAIQEIRDVVEWAEKTLTDKQLEEFAEEFEKEMDRLKNLEYLDE